jgi:hypothetical protein
MIAWRLGCRNVQKKARKALNGGAADADRQPDVLKTNDTSSNLQGAKRPPEAKQRNHTAQAKRRLSTEREAPQPSPPRS